MSGRFETLSRNDPKFVSYLDGSFSDRLAALPIRSLNVGTQFEEVTFEVLPKAALPRPNTGTIVRHLIRPSSLIFSIGPMITALYYCTAHGLVLNRLVGVTSFLGVVLFQIAMNLLNDYGDHMRGQDRIRPQGGSRAIQKGWLTAAQVRRIAISCLVGAGVLGIPALVYSTLQVAVFALIAGVVAIDFAFPFLRLKPRGWAEIFGFFLLGPMLVTGYAWAVSDVVSWSQMLLGSIFGAIALMYFHSANFENIMSDEQAGARTWATRAGFDASKKFFYFTAALTVACTTAYMLLAESRTFMVTVVLAQILFLIPVCIRVKNLASPLSSGLTSLRSEPIRLCVLTSVALIGTFLFIIMRGG